MTFRQSASERYDTRLDAAVIVAIMGPTGVGKSDLALWLAEQIDGEIISADSRQVYRGLEIGTAQPTAAELAQIPHHLVGFLDPGEPFSVAEYSRLAEAALREVATRRNVALVVGGTYHYVQVLLDGLLPPRVPPNAELRSRLAAESNEALFERLSRLDPLAASTVQRNNARRLIRAIEVCEATGRPFSDVGRRRMAARPALRLALSMPRAELYARIDARVDAMIRAGWLEEVARLRAGAYSTDQPALTSTGYRELVRHVDGEISLDEAVRLVKYSTHAYVRRQLSWLRRDEHLEWLDQGPDLRSRALERVRSYLTCSSGTI